ncbi:hypothetical protein [Eudoraea chungangensis]|uniref:hypothetical protein n=1 Tax=Eudoraea chungangensis TaxID=1481905 RepID=UPI0023ED3E61|nr:hypothetical protein [Eudoraea chungangensis]
MKNLLVIAAILLFSGTLVGQVAYVQFRTVKDGKQNEFVTKETKYWSKVAKKAIDKGLMTGWSLWRKVGITERGAPNYVIMNTFASAESIDQSAIWSAENLEAMGVSPGMVQTNDIAPTAFDYWLKIEDMIPGENKYVVVNYARPKNLGGFISENKSLWKPLHAKTIKSGEAGMTGWGMMSVIHPKGNMSRFSVLTWDGFGKMSDVMNYLSYQDSYNEDWQRVISKSKMNEYLPDGFNYSIAYELVMGLESE